jgi:microcystin-dependent protein
MANPFVGQIISVGFNFAPLNWFLCDGTPKPIAQYEVLYNLIGTTYGGDGITTFNVPDLRGRAPLIMGTGKGLSTYVQGQILGAEQITLTTNNLPQHNHPVSLSVSSATTATPAAGTTLGTNVQPLINGFYGPPTGGTLQPLSTATFSTATGGQPHENRQPFLALNYIICWSGVYPSQG